MPLSISGAGMEPSSFGGLRWEAELEVQSRPWPDLGRVKGPNEQGCQGGQQHASVGRAWQVLASLKWTIMLTLERLLYLARDFLDNLD